MRGYSLLEVLLGICITAVLSLVTSRFVQSSSSVLRAHSERLEERISMTKAALVVSASLTSLERNHTNGLVTITNGSDLTTPIGHRHPLGKLTGTSKPRVDSDILSSIGVDPRYRGRITKSRFNGLNLDLEVCELSDLPHKDQFKSYIALGLQGACQIVGTPTSQGPHCVSLSATMIPGLLNSAPCPSASLHELLPISREISLFVDQTSQLRLTSHIGLYITENQPILRGIRSMLLKELADPSGATTYQVVVKGSSARFLTFLLPGGLTREAIWNEVLL